MNSKIILVVTKFEKSVYQCEFSGTLEIGRQNADEPPPPTMLKSESGKQRLILVDTEQRAIPRLMATLESVANNQILVTNVHASRSLAFREYGKLESNSTLEPQESREYKLPATLIISDNMSLKIISSDSLLNDPTQSVPNGIGQTLFPKDPMSINTHFPPEPPVEEVIDSIPTMAFETMAAVIKKGDYASVELQPGDKLHHYRIIQRLAQGGMGKVYLAEHVYLKQRVALKTLRAELGNSSEIAERFLREAQALAVLSGTNVLKVQDASVFEKTPYVVMELLSGSDLRCHIDQHGPLTINQTMDMLEQIGDVLIEQERHGILHRDIKPSNIWVRENGNYCLIDYGLVGFVDSGPTGSLGGDVRTNAGSVMGTPAYMAPEQTQGVEFTNHRSDLFCLGATAYHCLTGKLPREFPGPISKDQLENFYKPLPSVMSHRRDISKEFDRILNSLTEPKNEDRYQTATDFMTDLEGYRYGRRRPYGATRGTVFIAIPFHRSFDGLYDFLREVCGEAKLAARRVDRSPDMKEIWHQIDKEIRTATMVISVFTRGLFHRAPNANVLTEAAHARALNRSLIVLSTDRAEKLPFDWRHLPILRYRNSKSGLAALREELLPRLRQSSRNPIH